MRVRHFLCAITSLMVATAVGLAAAEPTYADDDGSTVQIGVEWVGTYVGTGSPCANYGNLATSDDCVAGLHDIVDNGSTNWLWAFNWGNSNAWELDWKRPASGGNAYRLADDVDLVAFSGHGLGNTLEFNNQHNDWKSTPSEMDLGLRDCEWALMYTCNFLKGTPSTFGTSANGVHLICGYCTDMTITANGGEKFAYYAQPYLLRQAYGVRVAWYKYGQATQSAANENIARTFGATSAVNDYLWGYGAVAADPPAYSSSTAGQYSYWDTRLNW